MENLRKHILVIDDNPEMLEILVMILEKRNYRVTAMERLDQVESDILNLHPDLVLLDKHLGWIDGIDLCRQWKAHTTLCIIPVIIFSAYDHIRNECLAAGAHDFIKKPFDRKELLEKIALYVSDPSCAATK